MDGVVLARIALFWLTAMADGLQVTVLDKKKVAMLFQPTVLRCHFSTSSHQPAVVQWKFKSYCQDRMGESLGMSSPRAQSLSKRNLEWDPYLDCLDSRRTVRVVASKQGSTVTLGDFYRGREITIVHDADLQIGKLMWGDSGLYYCIITTPDDLEGKNEDLAELLVLEWVFVGLVILGVFLFFVLVGICWCQCCPHSCCCYVRCPCCPHSCCCPQAFRKGYRIQADKERDSMKVLYYVEKELAQFDPARRMRGRYNNTISELSSLHEEDSNFRQAYHQMRSKQFPVSGDLESNPDYWSGVMGGSSGASRGPSAMEYNKEDRESFRLSCHTSLWAIEHPLLIFIKQGNACAQTPCVATVIQAPLKWPAALQVRDAVPEELRRRSAGRVHGRTGGLRRLVRGALPPGRRRQPRGAGRGPLRALGGARPRGLLRGRLAGGVLRAAEPQPGAPGRRGPRLGPQPPAPAARRRAPAAPGEPDAGHGPQVRARAPRRRPGAPDAARGRQPRRQPGDAVPAERAARPSQRLLLRLVAAFHLQGGRAGGRRGRLRRRRRAAALQRARADPGPVLPRPRPALPQQLREEAQEGARQENE
ncbi:immunoglobulin-like domain-containing receptor 2 isoform X5 [Halichoerus grypus]|uniref:immunoglobulin-like domain-containing receptor 2 isoform X6 n=1 Tax=Halichoerus grypus TaxID=9711 RepID=UPI001659549B|nr:immunoglobulin-like domain-containing receptor 2 isoform X6 [Halichoerus grypus]